MRRQILIGLSLVALTFATFHPVWRFDFVALDDPAYVLNHPVVGHGMTWDGIVWAFTNGYSANWHPVTWLSHMLDVQWFGLDAGGHHATSLVLHAINTLLLFGLLLRLTNATARSALAAALFAVHPLHVESVAWISERKDVLSGCFFLLTLWAYAAYAKQPRAARYALVVVCFAIGLMAKPMLVTLPFVLLLLDWWPLASVRPWPRLIVEKLPLIALAAASSAITFVVQQAFGATKGQEFYSLAPRAANALHSYIAYLRDTFWPADLSVFYTFRSPLPVGETLMAVAILLAMSAVALTLARRAPFVFTGGFWFVGMLVPVIGLVQAGGQARADRYTYLPLIGVFIVISWGLAAFVQWRPAFARVVQGAALAAIVGCAVTAHAQVQHWRDGLTLWQHAIDVDPENFRAHAALGVLLDRERHDTSGAVAHLVESARIQPDYVEAHQNLALILVREGRINEAVPQFAEVVRLSPGSADALNDLGRALTQAGRADEAIRRLIDAARLNPESAGIHNNLGSAYAAADRLPDATIEFALAVRLAPNFEQAHFNLALALAKSGRLDDAGREFAEVLRINPRNAQARMALQSLTRGKS